MYGTKHRHNDWTTSDVLASRVTAIARRAAPKGAKFVDAGCGPEAPFLRHLPRGSVGVELNSRYVDRARKRLGPKAGRTVQRADFLKWKPKVPKSARIVVVGNPPYGSGTGRVNLSLQFIRHALTFAGTVVVLVGQNMRKFAAIDAVLEGDLVREYVPGARDG